MFNYMAKLIQGVGGNTDQAKGFEYAKEAARKGSPEAIKGLKQLGVQF
jgi:TPR repeat protein